MTNKIVWDQTSKRLYETGVDHGVLYPIRSADGTYPAGYAWNGLTTVTEKPSGAEAKPTYADNIPYLNLISPELFGATIEAFTYPDEYGQCDGSAEPTPGVYLGQQGRLAFGLAFRTLIGNDVNGTDLGYKLHLVYGCMAAPSEKAYATVNDSPEAMAFSWEVTTSPVNMTGHKPVSSIVIDSTKVDPVKLAALETILYGVDPSVDGRLPLPDEVISLLEGAAPSALTVTTLPADEAASVLVSANIVATFNNKIDREAIVLTTAAGVVKAVTRTWDTAHKVLTLHPTTSLTAGTTYLLTVAGVVDIYNNVLADSVINFATAS